MPGVILPLTRNAKRKKRHVRSTLRNICVELLTPLMVTVQVNLPESSGKTSAIISEHTPFPTTASATFFKSSYTPKNPAETSYSRPKSPSTLKAMRDV